MLDKPTLFNGDRFEDQRGVLNFINHFNFEGVKRFYHATNHQQNFVRAWQGHEREGKYIYVATGSALVGVVKLAPLVPGPPSDRPNDSTGLSHRCHSDSGEPPVKFHLSARTPAALWIPPGYANGWMNLEPATHLLFFSTATLEESKADDIRFPPKKWDIWKIES